MTLPPEPSPAPANSRFHQRLLRNLRPSHQHTALGATLLLVAAQMLSRVIGYLREAYIAWAFGSGSQTDAYVAAFQLPDYLYYLVAGGAASITFVSIYTRYLAEKREDEAERVFSIVLTVMIVVLGVLIGLGEVFTPQIDRLIFPHFDADRLALCVHLTRILLPMQLFFYVGGVLSAVLLSRRLFLVPALAPILYTLFIVLGGITLSRRMGIASLAVGAVAGAFAGPFLINGIGAARTGIRYRPLLKLADPGFREWVRLSIPLMLGVSLTSADEWIMRSFASGGVGDISHLNYAKRLFAVPYSVLGLAIGMASMTFFARLFSERRLKEFAQNINDSVFAAVAASLLLSAWLWAAALPAVDLVYRRGRFLFADSQATAFYFAIFAISLGLWCAQALYARAFYAARNTATPMIAASVITAASIPVFWAMFRSWGVGGLAIASDIGILVQTAGLALLLDRRGLVPLAGMRWKELLKALFAAAFAGTSAAAMADRIPLHGGRRADVESLLAITAVWALLGSFSLWITRSQLPSLLRRPAKPPAPEPLPEAAQP